MNKIGIDEEKPPLSPMAGQSRPTSAPPQYSSQAQLDNTTEMKQSSVWYVLSILSTIFCCLPCGVVGVVHTMIAQHDGELARIGPQRTRLRKAKCCTCVSFGLGLLGYALVIAGIVMASRCRHFHNIYKVEDVMNKLYFDRVYDQVTPWPAIDEVSNSMEESYEFYFDCGYNDTVETTPWPAIEVDNSMEELVEQVSPILPSILEELIPDSWLTSVEDDETPDEAWSSEGNSEIWEGSEEDNWEDNQEWGGGGHGRPRGHWGGLRNGNRGRGHSGGGGHDRIYRK